VEGKVALKNYGWQKRPGQAIQMAGVTAWYATTFNYVRALIGLGNSKKPLFARQARPWEEIKCLSTLAWHGERSASSVIFKDDRFSDSETHQMSEYDAQTCFRESVKVFADAEIDSERARTLRAWAHYELKRGNKEQGAKMWQEARDIFARLGAQMEVDRMNELPA
jgi:hypothetical protein